MAPFFHAHRDVYISLSGYHRVVLYVWYIHSVLQSQIHKIFTLLSTKVAKIYQFGLLTDFVKNKHNPFFQNPKNAEGQTPTERS